VYTRWPGDLQRPCDILIADFYRDQLFLQKGKKSSDPAKVDAQLMATALGVYFTNRNLAGTACGFP